MKASSALDSRAAAILAAGVLICICSGWLWWGARHDNSVPFLAKQGPAEWIVYPKPPDTTMHAAMQCSAVFRRSFSVAHVPSTARLSVRAFRQGTVAINAHILDELRLSDRDWKNARTLDVAKYLQPGQNEISVTVSNLLGPPALSLALQGDSFSLLTDQEWQVSLFGAVWQPAVLARDPPVIRPGNPLYGRERVIESLRKAWPSLLAFLLVSAALTAVLGSLRRVGSLARSTLGRWAASPNAPIAVLALIILAWSILFANNLPQLAALTGFDRDGHQQYIDYILDKQALPLADAGWQMYQPPLFYMLSALIIAPFGWSASADSALLALRSFSVLVGMAHLVLVFLCLRLVFPNQASRQAVGLLLAGFLPANLCLSHHLTNENLAAAFVTAALYFCLRLLRTPAAPARLAIGAGTCLGLALLTKFSAVLAVPFVLVALAWPRAGTPMARHALTSLSLALVSLIAVCGWHFARVWHRFGTPLIGNWDPSLPFAWWQDLGYHTAPWYWRFGEALICPLFSSFRSFADGMYSTLWGDGLCSGAALVAFRPQWNYDLMNGGYLLALLVTMLLVAGGIVFLVRFLRRPAAEGFLMLGLVSGFAFGIALMTMRVASYAQVKAFYALPALLPLCVLAVVGWDSMAHRSKVLRAVLWIGLLAWAMTSYAAFWIRPGNPFTYIARGISLADDGRHTEAAKEFARALRLDTNSLPARVGLAKALNSLGRRDEAWQQIALAVQQHPADAEAHAQAAAILGLDHHYDEAIAHLKQALAEAPDHPTAYEQLAACYALSHRPQQVLEACAQGLRITPFKPSLHHMLATAAEETGDLTNAIAHLRIALELNPKRPEARGMLALALASSGQLDQAAGQYQQAIQGEPGDAKLRYAFALTLSMQGKTPEAADQYRYILKLQPDNVESLNNLAWILAASPLDNLRNGAEAVQLAEHACELTQRREPVLLGTLAAAYAEASRFQEAAETAEKARALALSAGRKDVAEKNGQLLELYRAGKPYHEPAPGLR
jgi:tetratricopeptide (TPR) repeat protein